MASNPLHTLIDMLGQFIHAAWQCHHAQTNEQCQLTRAAWEAITDPFWRANRIPVEAVQRLAHPALAWCAQHGLRDVEHIATVERAAYYVVELAKNPTPYSLLSMYSNEKEGQARWDRETQFVMDAISAQDDLRRLAALAGDEWKGEVRMPWDKQGPRNAATCQTTSAGPNAASPSPLPSSVSQHESPAAKAEWKTKRLAEVGCPAVALRSIRRDPLPALARDPDEERQARYCQGFDPDWFMPALLAAEWRSSWYPLEATRESVAQWRSWIDRARVYYLGPAAMPEWNKQLEADMLHDLELIRRCAPHLLEDPGVDPGGEGLANKQTDLSKTVMRATPTDSSDLPVTNKPVASAAPANTPDPMPDANRASDPAAWPWIHVASDIPDLGSPQTLGAFADWCDRHIKTLENVRRSLEEKGCGEPFASIHLCSEVVLECIRCLRDFGFTALGQSPWVIHLLDKSESELMGAWLALEKGGAGVLFCSSLHPWLEDAQHLLEESRRSCIASGTASEPAEKLKQYRRGPEAKKTKTAKRNALIDQARSEGIESEDEIFKYVLEKDATLLVKKTGKKDLIDIESMMKVYERTKQAR